MDLRYLVTLKQISTLFQERFSRIINWIDLASFCIIAIIIIYYFESLPHNISIWLLPIVIFGLGYGLIIRALGLKISVNILKFSLFKKI